eukprot:2024153-Pleurochrysis_carterae.AAC.1
MSVTSIRSGEFFWGGGGPSTALAAVSSARLLPLPPGSCLLDVLLIYYCTGGTVLAAQKHAHAQPDAAELTRQDGACLRFRKQSSLPRCGA